MVTGAALMMGMFAIADSAWFSAPTAINIQIDGKIGADARGWDTATERNDAIAGSGNTAKTAEWNKPENAGDTDIACDISAATCVVYLAVRLETPNPDTQRTLTFSCSAVTGVTCADVPMVFSNNIQFQTAEITLALDAGTRPDDDTNLEITGAWT